jgi:hypothetical protein
MVLGRRFPHGEKERSDAFRLWPGAVAELPAVNVIRAIGLLVAPVALALGGTCPAPAAAPKAATCQVAGLIVDHFPTPRPWRWLGACPNGRAEGLGALRMGTEEEAQTFFFGRMHGGRPVAGYLQEGARIRLAHGFTPAGVPIPPDSSYNIDQRHAAFVLGSRAALATSRWFAACGNRASARWYRQRARDILDAEGE